MIEPTTVEVAIRGHSSEVRLKEHFNRGGQWAIAQAHDWYIVFPTREAAEAEGQRLVLALDEAADLERRASDIKAAAIERARAKGVAS